MRGIGHPDRRQFARSITARQFLRIAAVRLHSISGFNRNQTRRNHLARHTKLRQLPIQYIPRRPGFVTDFDLFHRTQFADRFPNRFQPVRNHTIGPNFTIPFRHSYRDSVGMDIQTNKE